MRAEIMPLKGKYYGTVVEITFSDDLKATVQIWHNGDCEPSEREIKHQGLTEEEYLLGMADISDSHFESKLSYDLAKELCAKINTP